MSRIFNRKRREAAASGKVLDYLKYAVGEIVLVVIGILIALSINNWNADKNEQARVKRAGRVVMNTLRQDTTTISFIIQQFEPRKELYEKIMNDQMPLDSVENCGLCPYLLTSIVPMKLNTNGYNLTKDMETDMSSDIDSLVYNTNNFYETVTPMLDVINKLLQDEVQGTFDDWKANQPWFKNWRNDVRDAAMNEYLAEDPVFKNRIAYHHLLLYNNFLPALEQVKEEATQLADQWEEQLKE